MRERRTGDDRRNTDDRRDSRERRRMMVFDWPRDEESRRLRDRRIRERRSSADRRVGLRPEVVTAI